MVATSERPMVAAIMTEYRPISHADVIVGRLLGDYDFTPRIDVVAMYTDQVPANDLSRLKAKEHGVSIYDTIGEAIEAGGKRIDGVLIIGEHGDYPINEIGQKMYPRKRLVQQSLSAMDALGLRVPLFHDKHLSYNTRDTLWIYRALRRRGIPFFGGSSISITDRHPETDPRQLRDVEEIVVTTYGGIESYGFHGLEVLQSLAEQRAGGETGIEYVEAMEGGDIWSAAEKGQWPGHLLTEAMKRYDLPVRGSPEQCVKNPVLFRVGYRGGLTGYVINLRQYMRGWVYACQTSTGRIVSALCRSEGASRYPHFDDLTKRIEELVITGSSPVPSERILMTSVMIDAAMKSLYFKKKMITPELSVRYKP